MVGSVIGLILGLFTVFSSVDPSIAANHSFGILLTTFPFGILLIYAHLYGSLLPSLQKAEQNSTPRILELFKMDPYLGFYHLGLLLFPLSALALGFDAMILYSISFKYLLAIWFLFIGVSLDLLFLFQRRILSYLNPYMVVQLFRLAAKRSIQNDKEADLCEWLDALGDIENRSIDKGGSSLCNEALNEQHTIIRAFLEASKSLSHVTLNKQAKSFGAKDRVTFTLFYLFQRLEMIFDKALERRNEPICSNVLTVFGKITIDAAKYDISLASYPLQYIGKLSVKAHQQRLQDIGLKAVCLYLELAKAILTELDITYMELQEPFFTMIHHLDELTKETFKQNKDMPIKALKSPFYDLRQMFMEGKAATQQDSSIIIADIDRVIAEFDALEIVLKTIPPLPSFSEGMNEKEHSKPTSTAKEDQNETQPSPL